MLPAMDSKTAVWIVDALLLLILFVGVPSIAAAIGYAAWKGKPKNFDQGTYCAVFVSAGGASGLLILYTSRMHVDVRTWQYLVQILCGGFGLLLFGIAMGCGIGIFTCRRRSGPQEPPE